MPKQKNSMTIEKLAGITQRGFVDLEDRLGIRIDRLENRMDELQAEVREGFKTLITQIQTLAKIMREGFQHVNARIDTIHHDISDLPAIREELHDLRQRVDKLERKVTAK